MARSMKEICPLCGLEFYDLDFHIRVDEECPEIVERRNPESSTPNVPDVWTVHGVGRLLRVIYWN